MGDFDKLLAARLEALAKTNEPGKNDDEVIEDSAEDEVIEDDDNENDSEVEGLGDAGKATLKKLRDENKGLKRDANDSKTKYD